MDQVFAQLALSTVTMVGKAAFGAASGAALRRLHGYYVERQERSRTGSGNEPEDASLWQEWSRLEQQVQLKMAVVTPAVDLVELVAARGYSLLQPMLALIADLRAEMDALSRQLEMDLGVQALSVSLSQAATITSASPTVAAQPRRASALSAGGATSAAVDPFAATTSAKKDTQLTYLMASMQRLLAKMEAIVPYLQLALTVSGANLTTSLPASVSPSRLLRASHLLSLAASKLEAAKKRRVTDSIPVLQLSVRVFTLFIGSMRKSNIQWTWKEAMAKATVQVSRNVAAATPAQSIQYKLELCQDLKDGRYHEETVEPEHIQFPVANVEKMYFSSAGRLLMIEDSKRATLVLKVLKESVAELASGPGSSSSSSRPLHTPIRRRQDEAIAPEPHIRDYDWYAFELVEEHEVEEECSEEESESETTSASSDSELETPTKSKPTPSTPAKSKTNRKTKLSPPPISPAGGEKDNLATLDFLLRLTALEQREQRPVWEIPDEKIAFYLRGDAPLTGSRHRNEGGKNALDLDEEELDRTSSSMRSSSALRDPRREEANLSVQDSPLLRKGRSAKKQNTE